MWHIIRTIRFSIDFIERKTKNIELDGERGRTRPKRKLSAWKSPSSYQQPWQPLAPFSRKQCVYKSLTYPIFLIVICLGIFFVVFCNSICSVGVVWTGLCCDCELPPESQHQCVCAYQIQCGVMVFFENLNRSIRLNFRAHPFLLSMPFLCVCAFPCFEILYFHNWT